MKNDTISRQAAIDAMATWDWQELYLPMCWIFDDSVKLFEFAKAAPSDMCDYLVDPVFYYFINVEHEPDDVFIVWKR